MMYFLNKEKIMYLAVFLCFMFLVLDFIVFSATYRCYKSYKTDIKIISDNLETLITSVECKKLSNFYLAIDFRTDPDPYVEPDIHHVNFSVFLRKSTGEHIIVPEFLFMDYYSDSDYEELY